VIVEPAVEEGPRDHRVRARIDGSGAPALQMPAGQPQPGFARDRRQRMHYVKQDGQAVFKFAVRKTKRSRAKCSRRRGTPRRGRAVRVAPGDRRIITSAADRLACGIQGDDQHRGLRQYDGRDDPAGARGRDPQGRLKKGDLVLLASVGAGFTVGSVLLRWAI